MKKVSQSAVSLLCYLLLILYIFYIPFFLLFSSNLFCFSYFFGTEKKTKSKTSTRCARGVLYPRTRQSENQTKPIPYENKTSSLQTKTPHCHRVCVPWGKSTKFPDAVVGTRALVVPDCRPLPAAVALFPGASAPICLPEKNEDFLGKFGWAAGWGALNPGSRLRPKTLQAVDVPVLDNR